jgi:hypothetical protein
MKKILGIVAVGFLCASSAHAQGKAGGFGIGSSPNASLTFGGGSVNGGSIAGNTRVQLPPNYRAQFSVAAFSGDASFAPSSFLSFESAVQEGKLESAAPKTVAEAAAENQAAKKAKSSVEFVQDAVGNIVPVPRF